MADSTIAVSPERIAGSLLDRKIKKNPGKLGLILFGLVLLGGIGYAGYHLASDISSAPILSAWPYVLLGLALLIALGFEFVNGFHDTANAVATVIYTHTLEPHVAVVWSGMWNLIGVLTSSGAVAYTIISLLPVELVLQVGKGAGFAMVFALLVAAILWNLEHLGLRASGLQFAHPDRLHHRRRLCQPADESQVGHQRRGLGSGAECVPGAARLSAARLRLRSAAVAAAQGAGQEAGALQVARRAKRRRRCGFADCWC